MHVPVIKLEVEGMKYAIHTALSERALLLDEQMKVAIDEYCTHQNIQSIINRTVNDEIQKCIEASVRDFFNYSSEGRKIVSEAVKKKLLEGYTTLD